MTSEQLNDRSDDATTIKW